MSYKVKEKEAAKQRYVENRKNLIELSKLARQLMESEEVDSVNEGLIYIYDQQQRQECEYNTFHQWKEKGFTIIKGVHAFCVWGQPRQVSQTPEGATEPEEYKYWPICYLFSNLQTAKPEAATVREEPEPEAEPAEVLEMDTILN